MYGSYAPTTLQIINFLSSQICDHLRHIFGMVALKLEGAEFP